MKKHRFNRMKNDTLRAIAAQEIKARNLTTPAGWRSITPKILEKRPTMFLLGEQYWYKYSSRVGSYPIGAAYLVGQDDGQLFAVRVPSTVKTIDDALDFLTPAAVRAAKAADREVHRQGDIFIVEVRIKQDDMSALSETRHTYKKYSSAGDPEWYRWVTHPQHPPVVLSRGKHYRAWQSTQVNSGGRRGGD